MAVCELEDRREVRIRLAGDQSQISDCILQSMAPQFTKLSQDIKL